MSDNEDFDEQEEIEEQVDDAVEDEDLDEDQNEDVDADEDVQNEETEENDDQNQENEDTVDSEPTLAKTKKVINTKKLSKFTNSEENKGVVFLSSVPMFMSPKRLRLIMSDFGEVGSLYLAPEGKDSQKMRKKGGGNGKKRWVEGWVEFMDKRVAKRVAESLNGTPVGGTKRSKFHDQIWNVKYLPGIKWRHLKEQMAYEISVRKSKLRAQISRGKREMEEYRKNFETSKRIAKRKRMEEEQANNNNTEAQDNDTNNNDIDTPPKPVKKAATPMEKSKPIVTDPRFQTHKAKLEAVADPRFKMDKSSKWKTDFEDPFGETKEDEPQTKKKKFRSK
mmetsp:Transcript_19359/g.27052  ORF Transcript_19359/g.27052 Transcript_19359/m.27052 type:complete len:335 (+) Transcript_19359:2-1006(+)